MVNGSQKGPISSLCGEPFSHLFARPSAGCLFMVPWSTLGSLLAPFWLPLAPFWLAFGTFWLPSDSISAPFGLTLAPCSLTFGALESILLTRGGCYFLTFAVSCFFICFYIFVENIMQDLISNILGRRSVIPCRLLPGLLPLHSSLHHFSYAELAMGRNTSCGYWCYIGCLDGIHLRHFFLNTECHTAPQVGNIIFAHALQSGEGDQALTHQIIR